MVDPFDPTPRKKVEYLLRGTNPPRAVLWVPGAGNFLIFEFLLGVETSRASAVDCLSAVSSNKTKYQAYAHGELCPVSTDLDSMGRRALVSR